MRVYIACLAAYNAGTMHGEWIDMDGMDADDLRDRIADMLRRSPCPTAEEWAVLGYDNFPDLGRFPGAERLAEVADAIAEHGPAMRAWLSVNDSPEGFEDAYRGTADNWEEFAAQMLEESGALDEMPAHLRCYFDFAAYARDLQAEGWWAARDAEGRMHFFSE